MPHTTGTPAETVCKEHSKQQQLRGALAGDIFGSSRKELAVKVVLTAGEKKHFGCKLFIYSGKIFC